ncbi:hypothetical protein [Streptomyces sp. NBC_00647]|uniref:hypothetical protein n=1 Tax=Streptomyces sp. NBC_00647 TaxID=2975796 RepID=UPI0038657DF3
MSKVPAGCVGAVTDGCRAGRFLRGVEGCERFHRGGGKIRQGGDRPGQLAQRGGVVVGPGRHSAVCGPPAAGGLHTLFLGGAGFAELDDL